jgi:adenosylhomocysteinase
MDMSFANQALSVEHLVRTRGKLSAAVHPVPDAIDSEIARLKLASLGVQIDTLSSVQRRYLKSWEARG